MAFLQCPKNAPLTAAQEKLFQAHYAQPTLQDMDHAFRVALGESATGRKVVPGQDGSTFEVVGYDQERFLTWRRPVEFPAVLSGPVTEEMRKSFLDSHADNSFTVKCDQLSAIRKVARSGGTLANGRHTDLELLQERLREYLFSGSSDKDYSYELVTVQKNGRGYKITSSTDLATGECKDTRYFVGRKGRPIDLVLRGDTDGSPIDLLIPTSEVKVDRMMWTKYTGEWQQNTHIDFSLNGKPIDCVDMGRGFPEGVGALLRALGVKKEAVTSAERAVLQEKAAAANPWAGVVLPAFPGQ